LAKPGSQGKWFVIFCVFVGFLVVMSLLNQQEEGADGVWRLIPEDEADVSMSSLLAEMTDRGALARWADPPWSHRHRSSTQRPVDEPGAWGWHRNEDFGHYSGMTVRDGRRLHTLIDVDGPGVITRIWSANPEAVGNVLIFIDDQVPAFIDEPLADFLNGSGSVPDPLAAERGSGKTSYLPIPYSQNIVIGVEGGADARLYYGIDYRTYPEGTRVQSFAPEVLDGNLDAIGAVGEQLLDPEDPAFGEAVEGLAWTSEAPGAISGLRLRFDEGTDPSALKLAITLDGVQTVGVSVGDFFGSGSGVNPFEDWDRTVTPTSMTARWVIPYERAAEVRVLGEAGEDVALQVATTPWQWDARSLYFGAATREQAAIPTRPHSDWPFARVEGRGFYVGDTLRVVNPVDAWWGAGDERFWVDGELVQVGTGTEDYYGYAYCSNQVFSGPFGGQPRNDRPPGDQDCADSRGHITNTRVRLLDRIPFDGLMAFELEIWHHAETTVDYAGTAYWYAHQ